MTKGLVLILSFYPWCVRDFSCAELKKKNSMGKNILRHILCLLLKKPYLKFYKHFMYIYYTSSINTEIFPCNTYQIHI